MNGADDHQPAIRTLRERRSQALVLGIAVLVLTLFMDLVGWFYDAGLFSLPRVLHEIGGDAATVDVDENLLRLPVTLALCAAAFGTAWYHGWDLSRQWRVALLATIAIGGGLIVDGWAGEPMITRYMAAQGYQRCTAGDHHEGNGKSQRWFARYVRADMPCDGQS